MPWTPYELNDGRLIPSIAYGSAFRNGTSAKDYPRCVREAYAAGFRHFDTSEAYHNEELVGEGLSSLPRSEVFVTTKWGETPAPTAIRASLKKLQLDHVDLYLIHQPNHLPRLPPSVIPALWEEMVTIRSEGLATSIGVGNFDIPQLEALLAASSVVPAVNQIAFNPLEYANPSTRSLLDYHASHGIRTEGYGANQPITKKWTHIMDVVKQIATKLGADDSDVLQAWARSKGVLVVTTSSSPERMKSYIAGGDLRLDAADIRAIDVAGEAEHAARIA